MRQGLQLDETRFTAGMRQGLQLERDKIYSWDETEFIAEMRHVMKCYQ